MTLLDYYPEISAHYPEYVTQKQVREICGISKATAHAAERRGDVPYEEATDRLLHTHKIKLLDALAFKYRREHGYRHDDEYISLLRQFYAKRLRKLPDVLTVADVAEATGYVTQSVHRWVGKGYVRTFAKGKGQGFRVPKESLLDFLASPVYNAIQSKSEKQMSALQELNAWYTARIGGVDV